MADDDVKKPECDGCDDSGFITVEGMACNDYTEPCDCEQGDLYRRRKRDHAKATRATMRKATPYDFVAGWQRLVVQMLSEAKKLERKVTVSCHNGAAFSGHVVLVDAESDSVCLSDTYVDAGATRIVRLSVIVALDGNWS